MEKFKKIMVLLSGMAFLVFLSACEQQGPAEKVGEKIDKSIEKSQEHIEEAGQQMQEAIEKAGEPIEETGENLEQESK